MHPHSIAFVQVFDGKVAEIRPRQPLHLQPFSVVMQVWLLLLLLLLLLLTVCFLPACLRFFSCDFKGLLGTPQISSDLNPSTQRPTVEIINMT